MIKSLLLFYCIERPRFINQPQPTYIALPYSTVSFTCEIYGIPKPTVTWYKVMKHHDKTIGTEDLQLPVVDSQKYNKLIFECFLSIKCLFSIIIILYRFTLQNVDDSMAGKYRCVGKNWLGSIQAEFHLLIQGI